MLGNVQYQVAPHHPEANHPDIILLSSHMLCQGLSISRLFIPTGIAAGLDCSNFRQPPLKSLSCLIGRAQIGLQKIPGETGTDDSSTKADDVHIIILDSLMRRKNFMHQRCTNAGYLVGSETGTYATAADRDTPLSLSAGDCLGQGQDEVRKVVCRI